MTLSHDERLSEEQRMIKTYFASDSPEAINIEAQVNRRVMSHVGNGRVRVFFEAECACGAILASEPWEAFKHSDNFQEALHKKPVARGTRLSSSLH